MSLLNLQHISNQKRILFHLHPNILTKLRSPYKVSILQNHMVKLLIAKTIMYLRVLSTKISMFLKFNSPCMNCFNQIYSHISQSVHIEEKTTQDFYWIFDWLINLYSCVTIKLHIFKIRFILFAITVILFFEYVQYFINFCEFTFNFIYAFVSGIYGLVHFLKKTCIMY